MFICMGAITEEFPNPCEKICCCRDCEEPCTTCPCDVENCEDRVEVKA